MVAMIYLAKYAVYTIISHNKIVNDCIQLKKIAVHSAYLFSLFVHDDIFIMSALESIL